MAPENPPDREADRELAQSGKDLIDDLVEKDFGTLPLPQLLAAYQAETEKLESLRKRHDESAPIVQRRVDAMKRLIDERHEKPKRPTDGELTRTAEFLIKQNEGRMSGIRKDLDAIIAYLKNEGHDNQRAEGVMLYYEGYELEDYEKLRKLIWPHAGDPDEDELTWP